MGRTFIRQLSQIQPSRTYTDTTASGSTMESSPAHIEDDLNNLRSQVNRILKADVSLNWYDDVPTINSKKRGLYDLNTDLDDLEEKRLLCAVHKLENITVPSAVQATGSLTTVAGANLVDGETVVISDGVNAAVTFEMDDDASVVETATLRGVTFSGASTADQVRDALITAIGNAPTLDVTGTNGGAGLVTLTADKAGTHANVTVTETVVDAGFVAAGLTGGAGDVVVLVQASSETPSATASVGNGSDLGAVVAELSGDVGAWDAAFVTPGVSTLLPKNFVAIRDASLHEGLTSDGRQVYGLLQVENGTVTGDSFNDTDNQVQISFFRIADDDTREPVPGQDIGGNVIEYVYGTRVTLDTLPEDCNYPNVTFTDSAASVSVTLNNAIDNQGATPSTQDTNIYIDMTTAGVEWVWRDDLLAELFSIIEGSAGGTSQVKIASDVDVFNVDAVENNFANGLKVDTGTQEIDIGVTSGTIESTGSNDLRVLGAAELYLDDGNQTGSSWAQTDGIKLSETQAEWNTFESEFGEVSLLNAIAQAKNTGGMTRNKTVAIVNTATIAADTNVIGSGGGANLDAALGDYSAVNFVTDVDIYVNGVLQRNGADASANHDVYPGTAAATGDLKFEYILKGAPGNPDVITMLIWGSV